MKRRYQRLAHSKWKAHIKVWQQSGGSQVEYCGQHDLSDKVFSLWKRRFQEAASEDSVPAATPAQDEAHGTEFIPLRCTLVTGERYSAAPTAQWD